jgi:photosystem II stability/assembly factor-like uncharacterized protein
VNRKSTLPCFAVLLAATAIGTILINPAAQAATPARFAGTTWLWQNSLPQGDTLNAISCWNEHYCFAVGDTGTILSTDATTSWNGHLSGTTQNLHGISCPAYNICFAVGDNGTIVATVNGRTWFTQSSGTTAPLTAVSCPATNQCFAVGGHSTILASNGVSWWPQPPALGTNGPTGISCPAYNTCFASTLAGEVLFTNTGGAVWLLQSTPDTGGLISAISCGSTTNCVAVDMEGRSIMTWTGGSSWVVVPVVPPTTSLSLYGISCAGGLSCVAVGSSNQLYWSDPSGNWHETKSGTSGPLKAISCETYCFAAGNAGQITTDYPVTYTSQETSVTNKRLVRTSCPTVKTCFAVGEGGIFRTTDGGATWTSQSPAGAWYGLNCPSATTCLAVSGGGAITGTSDGGATWKSQSSGSTAELVAVSCSSTSECFAAGTSILATTDGGLTWKEQLIFTGPGVFGITCTSATACVAVGWSGTLVTTSDGGMHWNLGPVLTSNSLQDVSCPAGTTTCLAVGNGGTLIATTDGGATWAAHSSGTTQDLLGLSCLKNPFAYNVANCWVAGSQGEILGLESLKWTSTQEAWDPTQSLWGVSCTGNIGFPHEQYRCTAVGNGGLIVSQYESY